MNCHIGIAKSTNKSPSDKAFSIASSILSRNAASTTISAIKSKGAKNIIENDLELQSFVTASTRLNKAPSLAASSKLELPHTPPKMKRPVPTSPSASSSKQNSNNTIRDEGQKKETYILERT